MKILELLDDSHNAVPLSESMLTTCYVFAAGTIPRENNLATVAWSKDGLVDAFQEVCEPASYAKRITTSNIAIVGQNFAVCKLPMDDSTVYYAVKQGK